MARPIPGTYDDPLDLVWLRCASACGLRVVRDPDVFASFDGDRTLRVCPPSDYDPDDSLAQLIFHELCHALVQGRSHRRRLDWGLVNTDDDTSAVAEHACHRLQAALLDRHGLRALLAVTTDWRPYWDALPDDPLAPGDDPAIDLAREAWPEAVRGPWSAPIHAALRATATIADGLRDLAPSASLWSRTRPRHPVTGIARSVSPGDTCGTCAWGRTGHCLAVAEEDAPGPAVPQAAPACLLYEPHHGVDDCRTCGACCHRGFHAVAFGPDEPLAADPPAEAVRDDEVGWLLPRPGGRCVLLSAGVPWTCSRYDERPEACRDFEIDGAHCLTARRRVGLSRL